MGDAGRTRDELVAELGSLRRIESRLQRIGEYASDVIAEIDGDGRFVFISANCERVLGYPAQDLIGLGLGDSILMRNLRPDDRERIRSYPKVENPAKGLRDVYRYQHADGRWLWIESRWQPFQTEEGEWHAIAVSRDVTDREEALRRLHQSEDRYKALSATTFDLVAELDGEGRLVFASPSFEAVLGYKSDELVGTTPFSLLHPDDIEPLAERFLQRVTASHEPRAEALFRARHRDGSWRWFQGGGVNFETLDGETHIVSVMRDVTDRLRAGEERRKLEERVQETQKLESLGVMAGGVAHDFNNLLTPILGDASLALMDLPADSPVRGRIERIQRSAHHASTLTHQLLDYAGIGSLDVEPVDTSKVVREMSELLQSAVSRHAVVVYDLPADLPAVRADPRLLSQVVVNLLTNASEAVEARPEGGGRITLRGGSAAMDREQLAQLVLGEELTAGDYVYFEVEDAGCGMDAATRARIFDPFFTTKFTGRGLGLAAVLGIVRKHGGAIEIESEPDHGTRIRVLWSAAGDEGTVAPAPRPGWPSQVSSGRVLVADDDAGAREIVEESLSRAGFDVLSAADGREAVETFRAHASSICAVLLDRTMPGASGEEALEEIRRIRSDVPILLVSGYARPAATPGLERHERCDFLQKPFLPEELVAKVRELLAG